MNKWIKLNQFLTGNSDTWSLNFKTLLSGVFRKGSHDGAVEAKIQPTPKSWIKVLLGLVVLSTILFTSVEWLGPIPFPWLTLIVATIVPLMISIFLYEFNIIERMKISDLVLAFFVGSTISFYAVGYLSNGPIGIDFIDLIIAACIEEIAKIIPVYLAIKFFKIKRVGTAFFVGYVIGSGFQIAETMGYSTVFGLLGLFDNGDIDYSIMMFRLLAAFLSHGLWGGIEGAAIMFSMKGDNRKIANARLAIWFGLPMFLHILWNSAATYFGFMLVLIIIQLLFIPLFLYMLDAIVRDNKEYLNSLNEEEKAIVEEVSSEEPPTVVVEAEQS